jgi:tetratricopeptide (TPR) repeat protein
MIDELPVENPARQLLNDVASAVLSTTALAGSTSALVCLVAYARALEHDAEWALARDVYSVVVDHAETLDGPDLLPDALQRLGYCRRLLGDVDGAAAAFSAGRELAEAQKNVAAELRLRLSEANLLTHRGNLPAAASSLDTLIADAASMGETQLVAAARHGRALVAYAQGDNERAALLCYSAADAYDDDRRRVAALADLANCVAALGRPELARRVNEIVFATSDVREFRWSAGINLLEAAATDMREVVFETYRRVLADEPLPPPLLAAFHLATGRGYAKFGRAILARRALACALDVSTKASLNQITIQADEALMTLSEAREERSALKPERSTFPARHVPSPALDQLAAAIDRLHATTVVG